jgi:hypothetical protein
MFNPVKLAVLPLKDAASISVSVASHAFGVEPSSS